MGDLDVDGLRAAVVRLRSATGLSQRAVAAKAGLSSSALGQFESGRGGLSLGSLGAVLKALDADLLDLHNALAEIRGDPPVARSSANGASDRPSSPSTPPPDPGRRHLVEVAQREARRLIQEALASMARERGDPLEAEPEPRVKKKGAVGG